MTDPATSYAQSVVSGKTVACQSIRLACERHLRDLDRLDGKGYRWAPKKGQAFIDFFATCLVHVKGEWAGKPIVLEPFQEFIIGSLFGWLREDGSRRFRTSYVQVPRKLGKSSLAAGVGLAMMTIDGEEGADIYAAATRKDQAKIIWGDAERMVQKSPVLGSRIRPMFYRLRSEATNSKFEALGRDSDSMDGLNPHCALIDELHAHPDRTMLDVLTSALGARRQPLIFIITTAGFNRQGVCWTTRTHGLSILDRSYEDETFFAFIAEPDEGDRWDDETTWAKVNPGLGVIKKLEYMRSECAQAKQVVASENNFRVKQLDEWCEQEVRWLPMDKWDDCPKVVTAQDLVGRPCWGGLDLASTKDLAAWVLVFDVDGTMVALCRFFVPEEGVRLRSRRDRVPYDQWAREGWLTPTEGNVTDNDVIRRAINEDKERFRIQTAGFDPWNALDLTPKLVKDGVDMVQIRQGFPSMSGPSKELEKLVLSKRLDHMSNPILRWNAASVVLRFDPNENYMPNKDKSNERIDGVVALIMALGQWMSGEKETAASYYEKHGYRSF